MRFVVSLFLVVLCFLATLANGASTRLIVPVATPDGQFLAGPYNAVLEKAAERGIPVSGNAIPSFLSLSLSSLYDGTVRDHLYHVEKMLAMAKNLAEVKPHPEFHVFGGNTLSHYPLLSYEGNGREVADLVNSVKSGHGLWRWVDILGWRYRDHKEDNTAYRDTTVNLNTFAQWRNWNTDSEAVLLVFKDYSGSVETKIIRRAVYELASVDLPDELSFSTRILAPNEKNQSEFVWDRKFDSLTLPHNSSLVRLNRQPRLIVKNGIIRIVDGSGHPDTAEARIRIDVSGIGPYVPADLWLLHPDVTTSFNCSQRLAGLTPLEIPQAL